MSLFLLSFSTALSCAMILRSVSQSRLCARWSRASASWSAMRRCISTHYDSQSGVSAADKGSQETALAAWADMNGVPVSRCYVIDAFSVDVHTLQTVTANMCDAGCSRVILTDTSAVMTALDDYNVTEAVEAVLWNDVVGEPMSMRVGLRVTSSDNWKTLVEAALDLNVKHFDVSVDGVGAPPLDSVRRLLEERSLDHAVNEQ